MLDWQKYWLMLWVPKIRLSSFFLEKKNPIVWFIEILQMNRKSLPFDLEYMNSLKNKYVNFILIWISLYLEPPKGKEIRIRAIINVKCFMIQIFLNSDIHPGAGGKNTCQIFTEVSERIGLICIKLVLLLMLIW